MRERPPGSTSPPSRCPRNPFTWSRSEFGAAPALPRVARDGDRTHHDEREQSALMDADFESKRDDVPRERSQRRSMTRNLVAKWAGSALSADPEAPHTPRQ